MQSAQLSDELLEGLSERLPQDWQKLGLQLGLKLAFLDSLSSQSRVHGERWPLRMLQTWQASTRRRHQVEELAVGLQDIERADLVQQLRLGIRETKDGGINDRLLARLAEHLPTEWYDLGIQLGLSSRQLDKIKMEELPRPNLQPELEVLREWRRRYEGKNIVSDLKKALQSIRRLDLVRYVDEHVISHGKEEPSSSQKPHAKDTTKSYGHSSSSQTFKTDSSYQKIPMSSLPSYLPSSSQSSSSDSRLSSAQSSTFTDYRSSETESFSFFPQGGRHKRLQELSRNPLLKSHSVEDRGSAAPKAVSASHRYPMQRSNSLPSPEQPIAQAIGGSGMFDFKSTDSSEQQQLSFPSSSAFTPSPTPSVDLRSNSAIVTSGSSVASTQKKS